MLTLPELPSIPFPRQDVLDLAPQTHYLVRNHPIARVRTFVGDEVWVVTGYEYVRALFNDERLGRSHHDPDNAARISNFFLLSGPVDIETEKEELDRMRALLVPAFSIRRMRALDKHVTSIVDTLLDAMADWQPPVDLHEVLSYPLSVRVICELLGVPYADRDRFAGWAYDLDSFLDDSGRAAEAYVQFLEYLGGLVEYKRREPGEDVVSDLIAAEQEWGLTPEDIARYVLILLFAGHPSTAANIDVGTVFLLTNPDQKAALMEEPDLLTGAVEEILRIVPLGSKFGQLRYAYANIHIGGVTIERGDGVLLMNGAANRDPSAFVNPNQLDITRQANAHLTFGSGPRRCLGSNLARLELTTVFRRLFQRFPGLRLVEPVEQLQIDKTHMVERLVRLLVTW